MVYSNSANKSKSKFKFTVVKQAEFRGSDNNHITGEIQKQGQNNKQSKENAQLEYTQENVANYIALQSMYVTQSPLKGVQCFIEGTCLQSEFW